MCINSSISFSILFNSFIFHRTYFGVVIALFVVCVPNDSNGIQHILVCFARYVCMHPAQVISYCTIIRLQTIHYATYIIALPHSVDGTGISENISQSQRRHIAKKIIPVQRLPYGNEYWKQKWYFDAKSRVHLINTFWYVHEIALK